VAEVLVIGGQVRVIHQRESYEDFLVFWFPSSSLGTLIAEALLLV
jgi:hypothetical protein